MNRCVLHAARNSFLIVFWVLSACIPSRVLPGPTLEKTATSSSRLTAPTSEARVTATASSGLVAPSSEVKVTETSTPGDLPTQHREFFDLLSAQQIALFRILTPAFIPDSLPLYKIYVENLADGHQEIRLFYTAPSNDPHSGNKSLFIILSNTGDPVTQETVTHQFKTLALDVQETTVRGQTGYLYWTRSGSGGNSAWLTWRESELMVMMSLNGDWPEPDEQNPHGLDSLLLQIAGSLQEASLWPTSTPIPMDWQTVTNSTWQVTFALPPGWKPAGEDAYQGPDGTARLEIFKGPGAWVGQACEWEANTHSEAYGDSPGLFDLPAKINEIDFGSDACFISSTQGGPSAVVFPNPSTNPKARFLILRLDTPNAIHIALSLKYSLDFPPQPTLSGSSYNTTPGSIQPADYITPLVTQWNGLTIEEYPIISTSVDSPGWFEFFQRIPKAVLDKRRSVRGNSTGIWSYSMVINGKQVKLIEGTVETPFSLNSQAQVSVDGKIVYHYNLLPYAGNSHIYRLGSDDNHWVLEVNGMLVVDGKIINQEKGYSEVFDWLLLNGKPFYFYVWDGKTYLSYDGQTLPLVYDRVFHKACCEPAAFNVGSNDQMVWFYAVKNGTWHYVELGAY